MSKKEKAKELIEKFDTKAIDVVQEIIKYVTNGEPDWTGKTIYLQELQNEIYKQEIEKQQKYEL